MDHFERVMNPGDEENNEGDDKHGCQIDVYIHNGCLMRKKMIKGKNNSLRPWDISSLSTKYKEIKTKQAFSDPDNQIETAELSIFNKFGIDVHFVVQPLDTSDFQRRLDAAQISLLSSIRPRLKTVEELMYFYEKHKKICFITDRNRYLLGSHLLIFEVLVRGFPRTKLSEPRFQAWSTFLGLLQDRT